MNTTRSFDTLIHAEEWQYWVVDGETGVADLPLPERDNSVVSAVPGWAIILSGANSGPIRLSVRLVDVEPPVETEEWGAVVDISFVTSQGPAVLVELSDGRQDLPALSAGPGIIRMRVQVRGREEGRELDVVDTPVEEHRITMWPASVQPTRVHKDADAAGAPFRKSAM